MESIRGSHKNNGLKRLGLKYTGFPLQSLSRIYFGSLVPAGFTLQPPSERFIRAGGAARDASFPV